MKRLVVIALLAAGCTLAVDRDHPYGFEPIEGMPDLPNGVHDLSTVRIVVIPGGIYRGGFPCGRPDMRRGCYLSAQQDRPATILTTGSQHTLGHEMEHHCRAIGRAACQPDVERLRAMKKGERT